VKVLLADDEPNIVKTLKKYLQLEEWEVSTAGNGLAAQKLLTEAPYDILVVDLRMPGMSGLELLHWLSSEGPAVPAIMISAYGEVEDAVAAMKAGASDYLVKPFEPEELVIRVNRAVREQKERRRAELESPGEPRFSTENGAVREVYSIVERAAPTDSTILITGESGTGKEVLAREIHRRSNRREGPFVAVNLGALPEQLLESELFGYERGAFTGAEGRKLGLLETASGGTLFLDEVGEMPSALQVKLLRAVQERVITRVGGTATIPVDFRLLAATNVDLEEAVREKRFREDLYFRLNIIRLELPPLRERTEDIPGLVAHFLEKLKTRTGYPGKSLSQGALKALRRYHYPGNIRELENIIERALILSTGELIDVADLSLPTPPISPGGAQDESLGTREVHPSREPQGGARTLREIESAAIERALLRNEWHRERTAEELGISRRTLLNKIKEYGLDSGKA
jgi:two-component system response regulator AtoC